MEVNKLFFGVEKQRNNMIHALTELIRIPAIGPENGGKGETQKAQKLLEILNAVGFDKIERYDAEDERVPDKKRPNIVVYYYGEYPADRLWIITHLDIVPPGEDSLWTISKPYEPIVKEGRIYGRGSEDNMHSMIASIFAVKALRDMNIRPKRTIALAFVADEEHGSRYGIQHLIRHDLFKKDDLIIVPDSGNEDGSFIEISEKSSLWFRIHTKGRQAHASRPYKGLNAHRVAIEYSLALDKALHEKYSAKDAYFDPPESTIEPTKKDNNVDAINIIPGEDATYFDCRILPQYDVEDVLADTRRLAEDFEKQTGAKITIEVIEKSVASEPTDPNSKVVLMLREAIEKTDKKAPRIGGIGGGTCAAYFRKASFPAAVWSTVDEVAHQPNEYTKIDNIVHDAKVYALLSVS